MVLIISETSDRSTDYVVEYLRSYECPFIRINEDCSANILYQTSLNNGNASLKFIFNDRVVNYETISCVWFRRGYIHHDILEPKAITVDGHRLDATSFIETENGTLNEYVLYMLSLKPCLGSQHKYNANKLITLHTAAEVGLKTPETKILSGPINNSYYDEGWIIKPIQDKLPIYYNDKKISPKYYHLTATNVGLFSHASQKYIQLQKYISPEFEIRIFFIGERYYSVAIFPPVKDEKRSDWKEVDRIVPYLLPDEIVDKLKKLNKKLHFNTGSIDMILDKSGSYFFLEVNPVGQLDFLSQASNYQIHKEIADYLFNYEIQTTTRTA